MNTVGFQKFIGLSGVAADERPLAQRWARYFEVPLLLVAFWIMIEWYLAARGKASSEMTHMTNWVVWLAFSFETLILTSLVKDKHRYLLTNWFNLLIILVGIPILWGVFPYMGILRSLRLFIVFSLVFNASTTLRKMLSSNHLGAILLVATVVISMFGILIAGIDPAISDPWDGIWWAWVTVTTVGYGDIVPVSVPGKVIASILMLFGLGLFSLITASFSVFFISRSEEAMEEVIGEEIEETEAETLKKLEQIDNRLAKLEQMIITLLDKDDQISSKK